jgi:hypothetical protein
VGASNAEHVAGFEERIDHGRDVGAVKPVVKEAPNEEVPDRDVSAPEPLAQEPRPSKRNLTVYATHAH